MAGRDASTFEGPPGQIHVHMNIHTKSCPGERYSGLLDEKSSKIPRHDRVTGPFWMKNRTKRRHRAVSPDVLREKSFKFR
jgi:hypothetical protein